MQETEASLKLTAKDLTAPAFKSIGQNFKQANQDVERFARQAPNIFRSASEAVEGFGKSLAGALSVGAVGEFTRRAFVNFAGTEERLTRVGIAAGVSGAAMQKVGEELRALSVRTGTSLEDLLGGFERLKIRSKLSVEQAAEIFPAIADGARAAKVTTTQMAEALTTAMRSMKVPVSDFKKVMDDLVAGSGGELADMVAELPKLATVMGSMGYTGRAGVQKMLAILTPLRETLGGTEAAATGLQQLLETMWSPELDEKLRNMPNGVANLTEQLNKLRLAGKDPLGGLVAILRDKHILDNPVRMAELFNRRLIPAIAAFAEQGKVQENLDRIKNSVDGVHTATERLDAGSKHSMDTLAASFGNLEDAWGAMISAMGANKVLGDLAGLFTSIAEATKPVGEAIKTIDEFLARFERSAGIVKPLEGKALAASLQGKRDEMAAKIPQMQAIERPYWQQELGKLDAQIKALQDRLNAPSNPLSSVQGAVSGGAPKSSIIKRPIPGDGLPYFGPGSGGYGDRPGGATPLFATPEAAHFGAAVGQSAGETIVRALHHQGEDITAGFPASGNIEDRRGVTWGNLMRGSAGAAGAAGGVGGGGAERLFSPGASGAVRSAAPMGGLPGAAGTGAMSTDGKPVPAGVLAGAEQLLRSGGSSGDLQSFMSRNGYPMAGNWCGEFAAAVVKSAGGTPPKGAAVASNWRNYGTPVPAGQEQAGDIAVRKGPRTGDTGSHVGFVTGEPGGGRFKMLGGNQGAPIANRTESGWDFRRAGGGADAGGLAGARAQFADELKNPGVRDRLMALTQAEVGSQGPAAQQAFMETVLNRAAARGHTLDQTLRPGYYPGMGDPGKLTPAQRAAHGATLGEVMQGSNVSGYATGNASAKVGFAGGPQTKAFGGERFGIEGPDRGWAKHMQGGAGAGAGMAPTAGVPQIDAYRAMREEMERPIKMNIEAPKPPSQLVPQFRRSSARNETNREFRDARWNSLTDIGAA